MPGELATGNYFDVLGATLLLAAVAIAAGLVPARRAGSLNPLSVLRHG